MVTNVQLQPWNPVRGHGRLCVATTATDRPGRCAVPEGTSHNAFIQNTNLRLNGRRPPPSPIQTTKRSVSPPHRDSECQQTVPFGRQGRLLPSIELVCNAETPTSVSGRCAPSTTERAMMRHAREFERRPAPPLRVAPTEYLPPFMQREDRI